MTPQYKQTLNVYNAYVHYTAENFYLAYFRTFVRQSARSQFDGISEIFDLSITTNSSHQLGMNYYVNFLGPLGSNGFQLK